MPSRILVGDCRAVLRSLAAGSVQTCITSPPYWGLRDYGNADRGIGLEPTLQEHLAALVDVFREVRRVLRDDGTLWLNYGDAYAGSWGAQSRGQQRGDLSFASGGQTYAMPQGTHVGSVKRAPGFKPKDLLGLPWRLAFALQDDGWFLRQDIIWAKPNPMPESVSDRCTKAHEYLFLLSKSGSTKLWRHRDTRAWVYDEPDPDFVWKHRKTFRETREPQSDRSWTRINLWSGFDYYFDHLAIQEAATKTGSPAHLQAGANSRENVRRTPRPSVARGGFKGKTGDRTGHEAFRAVREMRNKRSVWNVATFPFKDAHFATFPPDLIRPCVLAGSPPGGVVLDPFGGAGTTALVADREGRSSVLIEMNPKFAAMARARLKDDAPLLSELSLEAAE